MLSYGGAPCRCRKKRAGTRRSLVIALTMFCAALFCIPFAAGAVQVPVLWASARADALDEHMFPELLGEMPGLSDEAPMETLAPEDIVVGPYAKTAVENVNLRARPSLRADLVTRIKRQNTPIEVINMYTNEEGERWCAIKLGGYDGFIRSDLLLTVSEEEYDELRAQNRGVPMDGLPVMYITDSEVARQTEARIGNTLTMKFHMTDCYSLPEPAYQVRYPTRHDAISGGYVPCKNCTP